MPVTAILATLQDHKHTRESWAVATVLVVELLHGETPFEIGPGVEVGAVGDRLGLAAAGERLELRGSWDRSKFGLQLRVTEQVSKGIQEAGDACRWLERLDGVGPKLARALERHFGDRLPAILAGQEEADLTAVHGIGEDTAQHIRDSFAELAISGDLESIQFLDRIGATRWESSKILQWCAAKHRRPIEVLQEAPFDLMGVKGLGFKKVDRLARAAGCSPTAPARLEAATAFQLDEIVQRGSTMAPFAGGRGGGLVGEVVQLLGLDDKDLARDAVRRLAARGEVVIATDDANRTWVHPAALLRAERVIYRASKGKTAAPSAGTSGGSPGALPDQASVPCRGRGSSVLRAANGGECQGGGPPAEGGGPPPAAPTPDEWDLPEHDGTIDEPERPLERVNASLEQAAADAEGGLVEHLDHFDDW